MSKLSLTLAALLLETGAASFYLETGFTQQIPHEIYCRSYFGFCLSRRLVPRAPFPFRSESDNSPGKAPRRKKKKLKHPSVVRPQLPGPSSKTGNPPRGVVGGQRRPDPPAMDGLLSKLRSLDAYPKVNEDFYSRTLSGGAITLASSFIMLLLFVSELRLYLHAVTETTLRVDTSRGEKLRINFDITFPALQCSIISVDVMDISGQEHLDVKHDVFKQRIDAHGNVIATKQDAVGGMKVEKPLQHHGGRLEHNETYCGSCYGAQESPEQCCNSCEDVREAYRKKGWGVSNPDSIDQCKSEGFLQTIKDEEGEGCNIYGFLEINKVAGNFHFAPGKSFQQSNVHVHDLLPFQKDSFNLSHNINKLSFGEPFPGVINPLDGAQWIQHSSYGMAQYFVKVVPTVYSHLNEQIILSNQFSVTEHSRSGDSGRVQALPGVFFFYDLSPIKVTFTERHVSFLHFLTNVCAIVGGVFTVSGIIDSFVYHGQRAITKKRELGKFT